MKDLVRLLLCLSLAGFTIGRAANPGSALIATARTAMVKVARTDKDLDPKENYGQVYIRTNDIDEWYQFIKSKNVNSTKPERKPWKQNEFSILDPDNNLLTFGQSVL